MRNARTHTQTLHPRQEAVSNDGRMTLTRELAKFSSVSVRRVS